MPQETLTAGGSDNRPTTVRVGWSRESEYVQLATTGWYLGADPDAKAVGVFADLNRVQINTLIRNLRKARDAAYGRDE